MVRAADFPPPFRLDELICEPTDPPDERIEVGVLVVGAGPAGLACAIRFGQLVVQHPEAAETLGDVPLAVVEKGKQPGSHLLSGAVVNPAVFQDFNGWASGSATDVTTQTALVWNSGASITAYTTTSVWAQFYFLNMAIQSSDTFTYQLGINLENPQYGYGTFLMPTLTGQG